MKWTIGILLFVPASLVLAISKNQPYTSGNSITHVGNITGSSHAGDCTENVDAPLTIVPQNGNMFGGTPITLRGPCFHPDDIIECTFEGINGTVEGVLLDGNHKNSVLCTSPEFQTRGWKRVHITIQNNGDIRYNKSSAFYADNTHGVQHNFQDVLVHPRTPITLTWSPVTIAPMMGPTTYLVDIAITQFDPNIEQWKDIKILAKGVENNGTRQINVPLVFSDEGLLTDVRPIAFQVRLGQESAKLNARHKRAINVNDIKQWSSVLYYGLSNVLRKQCMKWYASEPDGQLILDELPPCPPQLSQARQHNNTFVEDTGIGHILSKYYFHKGTDTCLRSKKPSPSGYGQQCCYKDGDLVVGPPNGGTVDKVPPGDVIGHFKEDVLPYFYCCKGAFSKCKFYYEKRPSDNGSRYEGH